MPVPRRRRGVFRRLGGLRHSSPGRLQLLLGALLTLGVLTGLVAGLTGNSAAGGTSDLGNRAQPLLVEAETIYSALADADTTAAQAFLAGGLEPAALTQRYNEDLERATTAISSAARRTPEGSEAAVSVGTLSSGVARYAALVATARADNRQGLPVGASYLSAASELNRQTLLPQAQNLFRIAQEEVDDGYSSASSIGWVLLLVALILGLLAVLVLGQRYLSRSTHRTFNVPLVGATVLTVVLALGIQVVLAGQHSHLGRAKDDGSAPVAKVAEARILALRERGDEALTLAARGSGSTYTTDFTQSSEQLGSALGNEYFSTDLRDKHSAYLAAHRKVRELDDNGDYDGAVKLAIGPETTQQFESFTTGLNTVIEEHKADFTREIGAAGRGLGLLTVFGPLLALLICMLAFIGIRARLEEYR
ncbi:hypothetical protein ACIA5D_19650 [Actinoplanes sp. NPDC051513]|uniref:hypothetical protein n=1 Tax=Actinoplanes sp. NPDC051513 TaxID=3363908 RepID=UPI0037B17792